MSSRRDLLRDHGSDCAKNSLRYPGDLNFIQDKQLKPLRKLIDEVEKMLKALP